MAKVVVTGTSFRLKLMAADSLGGNCSRHPALGSLWNLAYERAQTGVLEVAMITFL